MRIEAALPSEIRNPQSRNRQFFVVTSGLGNGNGTFTAAGTPQSSGGATWILSLGDIDGDELLEGIDGAAKIKLKAKGANVNMPDLSQLTGTLDLQLQRTNDSTCWGATYTPPFKKAVSGLLKASSDAPPTLPPIWSEIHANVIGPGCGGCHGGSGGLSGLADCNTAHASW